MGPVFIRFKFLVHESIYELFIALFLTGTEAIRLGHPLDPETIVSAQASTE
jgi:aldehyde dehydrogenase